MVVRVRGRLVARTAAAGVLATALGAAGGCSSSSSSSPSSSAGKGSGAKVSSGSTAAQNSSTANLQSNYEHVISSVLPSVVQITSNSELGSGIVFDGNGDVITNNHVVAGANSLKVTLSTSSQTFNASVVNTFPQGDLAIVRISNPPSNLKPATFADSGDISVGQIVLAMGNPIGLSSSATDGIISATGRTVTEPQSGDTPAATLTDMIQTSAPINPGNSGGALVDLNGDVVGIPTLTAVDQQLGGTFPGIGFAISSNTAKNIADQIISQGKVTNSGIASLGVTVRTITDANLNPVGAGVVSTVSGGPAAGAGIVAGDVITSLDNTAVTSAAQLSAQLATLRPGDNVPVGITKTDGSKSTVTVTLGTLTVS